MSHRLAWLSLVAALLSASQGLAAEAQTGWTEVQTAHVTLKTDLHLEEARHAALTVERTRAALLTAAWPSMKLLQPERIEVVVFASHQEFQRYFGEHVMGLFAQGAYPPTAFLYGTPENWVQRPTLALEDTTSVLKHELTHHLAAYLYRRQPKWFSEGMAQFFETLRLSDDGRTAVLGDVNLSALRGYNANRTLRVADAFAWNGKVDAQDEVTTAGLYGVSWLLVHWLYNTHPVEFDRYQTLLVKGVEPSKAWAAVFPSLKVEELDSELNHYVHLGEFRNIPVAVPAVDTSVRDRPMTGAEVHATRAAVALAASRARVHGEALLADAQTELAAALAEDPANVRALQMKMATLKLPERVTLGRSATAAHPDDGLAWLMLAEALREVPEASEETVQAYRKATQLLPDHPMAFNNLAWMELQRGRPQQALPRALTAVRLAPWDSAALDTLAAVLAALGRCSEAAGMQARAVEMLPDRVSEATRAQYTAKLVQIQARCTEAPPVPGAQSGTPPPSKP